MLGDEAQKQGIKVTVKTVKLTTRFLKWVIQSIANQKNKEVFGKQSIKKLNHKQRALESIPVTSSDIQGLQKELKKFGVDFSAVKRRNELDTYDLYFKSADISQIETSLKNYVDKSFSKGQDKKPMKERAEAAIQKAKEQSADRGQQQEKERQKQKEPVR